MKKILITFIIFSLVSLFGPVAFSRPNKSAVASNAHVVGASIEAKGKQSENSFKVKLNDGRIIDVSSDDYLIGCIAGEMPVTFSDEALKAQGVAAYTFALYKKNVSGSEYDITADYRIDQCYLTEDELRVKWGDNYETNRKHIGNIVKSIKGKWISYDNQPILSVYHSVSCGKTYSCKEVWGKDLAYLSSVDSSFDKLSDQYQEKLELSPEEFYTKLGVGNSNTLSIDVKKEKSGRVREVSFDNKLISGKDMVEKLALKSQNFTIVKNNESIIITTYGRGHGVGMSQVGADYLAKSGSSYKEILHHYYRGCSIEE